MKSKKIKPIRMILVVLMIIGTLTVIDNAIRLVKEISSTVSNHRWNLIVVK